MKDYDSDSSDGEDAVYTETSTLLGYASRQATGDCTKLGGLPSWIDEKTAPSGRLAKCKVCNGFTTLLLQVNGDMPDKFPGHERRLYIFICRNKACRRKSGSVRSIRASRVSKLTTNTTKSKTVDSNSSASQPARQPVDIGATLFGTNSTAATSFANPFSSNSANNSSPNPFASSISTAPQPASSTLGTLSESFASKVRLSPTTSDSIPAQRSLPDPHEPWPTNDILPSPYPELFLDAEYETLSAPQTPQIDKNITDIDMNGAASGSGGGAEDKDLFESTMDKTFQRFADRIAANPEQAIRYEFGGTPLLYSDSDPVGKTLFDTSRKHDSSAKVTVQTYSQTSLGTHGMPHCIKCGAARVFEVQLMPHAITELETDDMSVDGMEWGTIIVGVCASDCALVAVGEVGYVEEWCGVQYEELVDKRR